VPLADFTAFLPSRARAVGGCYSHPPRSIPSWVFPSPRSSPPGAMPRLIAAAPPMHLCRRTLDPVAQTVRPPAALRSVARPGGGFASLETAVPS